MGPDPSSGAVPEPATWGMIIVGFGLTGAAIRRRRAEIAFA
ncbi:PEPxxWA-CTERM sorting domain-containing protein [Sphingomonas sp. GB1N7]